MQPETKLKSLTFATDHHSEPGLASVRCTLTNEEESPVFDHGPVGYANDAVIEFESIADIRKVEASEPTGTRIPYVINVRFLNEAGKVVKVYDPANENGYTSTVNLA